MTDRLFERNNVNADIMIVPTEEGSASDDRYCSSIGDATNRHVHELADSGRQMWEGLIHMSSGTIFRIYPNPQDHDPDPYKLKGKKLENYLEVYRAEVKRNTGKKLTDSELIGVKEAIEEEQTRREHSQDVYEKEDLIPYHEWQNFPHIWDKVDIPSTPQDKFAFMGNTSQMFYDWFPEGHPNEKIINQCLMILNREWPLEIDEGYASFVHDWLENQKIYKYVRHHLQNLIQKLLKNKEDPDELVKTALQTIDQDWAVEVKNAAASRAIQKKMTKVILHKEQEWEQQYKEGLNVYGAVKSFGRVLFQGFRDQMNSWHWARYRAAKRKYAPRVILYGYDVNRCSMTELAFALNVDLDAARKVWFHRPFETLENMYSAGFLTTQSFTDSEATEAIVSFLEKHAKIAEDTLDLKRMAEVCKIMLDMQRKKKGNLTNSQWSLVWRYYKILKKNILLAVQNTQVSEIGEQLHV